MNNIPKFKIFYVISLLILAVVLIMAVFKPFISGGDYTEVSRQSLLRTEDEWILQFDILNHEGRDIQYTIHILFANKDYTEDFVVRDGGKFTYINHIKENNLGNGQVTYMIYKENAVQPFETGSYYLK